MQCCCFLLHLLFSILPCHISRPASLLKWPLILVQRPTHPQPPYISLRRVPSPSSEHTTKTTDAAPKRSSIIVTFTMTITTLPLPLILHQVMSPVQARGAVCPLRLNDISMPRTTCCRATMCTSRSMDPMMKVSTQVIDIGWCKLCSHLYSHPQASGLTI